jgi:hypothetical protein
VNTLIHRRCVRNILLSASPMLMQYRDSLGDHFAGLNDLDTPANRAAAKPDRTIVRHRSKPPSPPGNSYTLWGDGWKAISVVAPPTAAAYARSSAKSQVHASRNSTSKKASQTNESSRWDWHRAVVEERFGVRARRPLGGDADRIRFAAHLLRLAGEAMTLDAVGARAHRLSR